MATPIVFSRPGRLFLLLAVVLLAGCERPLPVGDSKEQALATAIEGAAKPAAADDGGPANVQASADASPSADEFVGGNDAESLEKIKARPATHHQSTVIRAATEPGSSLQSFVIAPNGDILALAQTGGAAEESHGSAASLLSGLLGSSGNANQATKPAPPACEVKTFNPAGKPLGAWPVKFMAQAMCLGPDDSLFVAGSGRVARYSFTGGELVAADSPQAAIIEKDRDALRAAAEAQIEEEKERSAQMTAGFAKQRAALAAKLKKSTSESDQRQLQDLDTQIEQFIPKPQSIDDVMAQIVERLKRVNAIAASDKEVFITCGQTKGYGYSVWRTDLALANPECIITGLSGCCGQMDVCCDHGNLWVAENARHRVGRYSREGKRLASFGKRDREGVGECFGGCCNPMNLCVDKAGDLLVSESDGHVKHFTAKGKFIELAGIAQVQPGCKNSAVKTSPDGERIYYIDVNKSQIIVLARGESSADVGK